MAFVARPIAQIADAGSSSDGNPASAGDDSRPILISSVEFDAEDPDLAQLARSVVTIRPNFSYTVADISADERWTGAALAAVGLPDQMS